MKYNTIFYLAHKRLLLLVLLKHKSSTQSYRNSESLIKYRYELQSTVVVLSRTVRHRGSINCYCNPSYWRYTANR